jgi:hypothetical protein
MKTKLLNLVTGAALLTASFMIASLSFPSARADEADIDSSETSLTQTGPNGSSDIPEGAIEVEMKLDCTDMSTQARAYANEHRLCDDASVLSEDEGLLTENGTALPMDTQWGNCGSSWIYVFNNGGGNADVLWGFNSTLGTVVHRNLTVYWSNWHTGMNGSFLDKHHMFSSFYQKSRVFHTKPGSVLVGLTGTVTLVWGGQCVLLIPTDVVDIS